MDVYTALDVETTHAPVRVRVKPDLLKESCISRPLLKTLERKSHNHLYLRHNVRTKYRSGGSLPLLIFGVTLYVNSSRMFRTYESLHYNINIENYQETGDNQTYVIEFIGIE